MMNKIMEDNNIGIQDIYLCPVARESSQVDGRKVAASLGRIYKGQEWQWHAGYIKPINRLPA